LIDLPSSGAYGLIASAPELGLRRRPSDAIIRERNSLYAKKLLGRLLGKIPD
jgi:hypothetical protein